jgi:hypothetical protein
VTTSDRTRANDGAKGAMGVLRKVGALAALVVAISFIHPMEPTPRAPAHHRTGPSFALLSRAAGEI